jgi:sugar phosphate permease
MGLLIGVGLIFAQTLLVSLYSLTVVAIGILGLRLFGQGLSSSLSSIAVARYFNNQRGKALALSQLGFPVFEGLITPLGAFLLPLVGPQTFGALIVLTLVFFHIPMNWRITGKLQDFNLPALNEESSDPRDFKNQGWTRGRVFKHPTVYFLIPHVLMPPFALTGVFFHQAVLAEQKGWSLSLMASGLFFFAIGRICSSFLTGPLVDKLTAIKLFTFYQFPLCFGFLIFYLTDSVWAPGLCFLLFGLAVGSGGPIKSAIWAELYGVRHLGAIKSLFATFMIFSTAASPALFGFAIDHWNRPDTLFFSLFCLSLITTVLAFIGLKIMAEVTDLNKSDF